MPRHRYKTDFTDDYAKFRSRIDRDYAERAQKTEESSMLREPEPDYEMHTKPYKADRSEKLPWETEPQVDKTEAIEKAEPVESEPLGIEQQQEMYEQLLEQTEGTPVEDLELEIKPADFLEPVEKQPFDAEPKKTDAEGRPQY